jgi:hypothetical protein
MEANELQRTIELHGELQVLLKKAQNLPTKEAREALWDEAMPLVKDMLWQFVVLAEKYGREKECEELLRDFKKEFELA